MSDVADAGSNPAANDTPSSAPEPVTSAPNSAPAVTQDSPQSDAPPPSAREALTKALAQVEQTGDQQQPAKTIDNRDPATGKFTPKDKAAAAPADKLATDQQQQGQQQPVDPAAAVAPPSRFTKQAQAEWAKTPPIVQQEVNRLQAELTQGIEKYRQSAEAFEPIRPFYDMAKQHGTTVETALQTYVELDKQWGSNPLQAFFVTCEKANVNPQQLVIEAYNAMQGQPQQADPRDGMIRQLQQQIAGLEGKVGQVAQTWQEQQAQQAYNTQLAAVTQFGAERPYFQELIPTMTRLVETGFASDLSAAYENAVRLNPEISAKIEADKAAKAAPQRPGSNPKASLSITGNPSPGSNPSTKPAGSPREAVARALAQVGV